MRGFYIGNDAIADIETPDIPLRPKERFPFEYPDFLDPIKRGGNRED